MTKKDESIKKANMNHIIQINLLVLWRVHYNDEENYKLFYFAIRKEMMREAL